MGADYIYEQDFDRDSLQRAGVQVILECDDLGIATVKISHTPDTFYRIVHNEELVDENYPDEDTAAVLASVQAAENAAKDRNTRITEKVGTLPVTATPEEVVALVTEAAAQVDAEITEEQSQPIGEEQ